MDLLLWPSLGALVGLAAGSFLATLVLRWPAGRGLGGRSACDACGVPLGAAELVPVWSWVRARGRCRHCGAAIDATHPALELAGAAIGAIAFAAAPGLAGLGGALLGWGLMALAALDLGHQWLPDRLTLPLLALGLALGPAPFADRALAAAIAGGTLLLLALGYRRLRGHDGLGMGDVKLGAALGAWLSPAFLAPLLLLAALAGLALAGIRRLRGEPITADSAVPFGACLALAGFPLWIAAVAA